MGPNTDHPRHTGWPRSKRRLRRPKRRRVGILACLGQETHTYNDEGPRVHGPTLRPS